MAQQILQMLAVVKEAELRRRALFIPALAALYLQVLVAMEALAVMGNLHH
jgi:hypothetical protein